MRELLSRVAKQTFKKTAALSIATVMAFSGLAAAAPLFTQKALAASYDVCASGCDYSDIQTAINNSTAGDTIMVGAGTYTLSSTLTISKSVTIDGAGSGTVINATGVGGYGVYTNVDNVTIENLSILGPTNGSGYGLKVEGSSAPGLAVASNINVTNVAVSGSYRTGIDLNGINGATLTNVRSTGTAHGNGIGITDSHNITINGAATSGNAWGGIALYATGNYFACGVDNVTLTGANNLGDLGALYTGIDNIANPDCTITNLHISSSDLPYKVTLDNSDPQDVYTVSLNNAALVAAIYSPFSPVVSASGNSTNLWVAPGQTIQSVVNAAQTGDTVNVPAGTYSEDVTISKPLALLGAQAGVAAADQTTGTARSGSESSVQRFLVTSSGVTIDGFSLTGTSTSGQVQVLSASTLSGINVKDNIFSGYRNVAMPTNAAGNIVIDGNYFTSPSVSAEAIQIKTSGNNGDCSGTQVLNNVFTAATTNGAADINLSCTGSDSTNVTVSGNRSMNATDPNGPNMVAFSGVTGSIVISNNTASTSGSQVLFFGSVSGTALISGNDFSNGGGNAVSIHGGDNYIGVNDSSNTGTFTITNNSFVNNAFGVKVATGAVSGSGTVNADHNYWGSASPDFSALVSDGVTYLPYYTDSGLTQLSKTSTSSNNIGSLIGTGAGSVLQVSGDQKSVTVKQDVNISVPGGSHQNSVFLPSGTQITETNGNSINTSSITASVPSTGAFTSLGKGKVAEGALQWGIPGIHLSFSQPITLSIYVGTGLNGQTLNIVHSATGNSGWTSTGIVSPATCVVSAGYCTFQATEASYYAATKTIATNSGSHSSNSGGSHPVVTASSSTTSSPDNGVVQGESTENGKTSSTKTEVPVANLAQPKTAAKEANGGGLRWYWVVLIVLAVIGLALTALYRYAEGTDRA